jgi:hypothetical protein
MKISVIKQNLHSILFGSCKEKAQNLYTTNPTCIGNKAFLYISEWLTEYSISDESIPLIMHSTKFII